MWKATCDGRKVILKSYRCYVDFDVTKIIARFQNEIRAWTLLHQGGVGVVPLVGIYSTEAHPFGLVYELVDGLDLRQYLKSEPNVGKKNLLIAIARCLSGMHNLGIVHGELRMSNVLVDADGTPRIAGLGNATISGLAGPTMEDEIPTGQVAAPELMGMHPSVINSTHPTKADDMHDFGVMAYEVLTGRPTFPDVPEIAAACSMLSGTRPPRPDNHAVTDVLWYMIERCWHTIPSRRITASEVVDLLLEDLQ